jgi:predicted dehydrogenase
VIVTTIDRFHHEYIIRTLEAGCDAISEKPMTIDDDKCRAILAAEQRTGRRVIVTFNMRFMPYVTRVKELLREGIVGRVLSVDLEWFLDTRHGADYFRRWHRNKENSGGLMVHKATHHFDLVNWWLSAVPSAVFATGRRAYYTPRTAERLGLSKRGERCLDCPEAANCPFVMDMRENEGLRTLYLENEGYDGYFRDRCVFSDKIDIEDVMNLTVSYDTGATMSYSLHAFMPWEGYVISFNGAKGRIELKCEETAHVIGDGSVPGALKLEGTWIKVYPHFAPAYQVDVWKGQGGHGGGDDPLLTDVFDPNPPTDKYLHAADQRSGAYSILTGIAANTSMQSGQPIRIADLVSGLEHPDYPAMPTGDEMLVGK